MGYTETIFLSLVPLNKFWMFYLITMCVFVQFYIYMSKVFGNEPRGPAFFKSASNIKNWSSQIYTRKAPRAKSNTFFCVNGEFGNIKAWNSVLLRDTIRSLPLPRFLSHYPLSSCRAGCFCCSRESTLFHLRSKLQLKCECTANPALDCKLNNENNF